MNKDSLGTDVMTNNADKFLVWLQIIRYVKKNYSVENTNIQKPYVKINQIFFK